jgi:hypothetical protein
MIPSIEELKKKYGENSHVVFKVKDKKEYQLLLTHLRRLGTIWSAGQQLKNYTPNYFGVSVTLHLNYNRITHDDYESTIYKNVIDNWQGLVNEFEIEE